MPLPVILESPYSGNVDLNTRYARACLKDSLSRNEAPIASHLLYTQEGVLDDNNPEDRKLGIEAGLAWCHLAERTVVYIDLGITEGMTEGIERAESFNKVIITRSLPEWGD